MSYANGCLIPVHCHSAFSATDETLPGRLGNSSKFHTRLIHATWQGPDDAHSALQILLQLQLHALCILDCSRRKILAFHGFSFFPECQLEVPPDTGLTAMPAEQSSVSQDTHRFRLPKSDQ